MLLFSVIILPIVPINRMKEALVHIHPVRMLLAIMELVLRKQTFVMASCNVGMVPMKRIVVRQHVVVATSDVTMITAYQAPLCATSLMTVVMAVMSQILVCTPTAQEASIVATTVNVYHRVWFVMVSRTV